MLDFLPHKKHKSLKQSTPKTSITVLGPLGSQLSETEPGADRALRGPRAAGAAVAGEGSGGGGHGDTHAEDDPAPRIDGARRTSFPWNIHVREPGGSSFTDFIAVRMAPANYVFVSPMVLRAEQGGCS